ncbi:reverse transcriptase domain-containing protein [Tanacetum coccineum]
MEEDYEPSVQSQRRVNPKIHDVIKKEVEKLLDAGLIYPISDSPWSRLEVDRAKVEVIAKLPHPTTVKGVRSFLGHAGFYRRFIQDFSKIARPMTHFLEKETPFFFSEECIESFNTLKRKLTEAPILIAPDWDLPFELMCDASDFAIGAVLGQRKNKHFQPIHYASKTMNEAQTHYTTTEKELLAVVFETKKGAGESSPPIILSNLKIPPQDKLQRQRNQYEAFPLENLGSISTSDQSTPCSVLISDKTLWFFSGQEALGLSHKLARDYWGHTMDFPDCEDSRARSIHMSFTSSASFWESRNGYHTKGRKTKSKRQTKHGMEKTVKDKAKSKPKRQ